ncbi:hypothetical protein LCGC14_0980850 [marine sediment metagenome]|uniref:Uncharacterized protein n=1 Tax=marine sediment metagenome TaxID=412755 RepID=A0A0F9NV46_9ZZZZ
MNRDILNAVGVLTLVDNAIAKRGLEQTLAEIQSVVKQNRIAQRATRSFESEFGENALTSVWLDLLERIRNVRENINERKDI